MLDEKKLHLKTDQQGGFRQDGQPQGSHGARSRLMISAAVLALFWGALLYEYAPDLVPAALRLVNSARAVGAEKVESRYFDVSNNSNASAAQLNELVGQLEEQYETIAEHTQAAPSGKIPVLFTNGQGPALTDGTQLMINYNNGLIDIDLVPLFLVWLMEEIPVNPQEGLVAAGGHALQVVEAAELAQFLVRQPLDSWVVLLQWKNAYIPLEEAWLIPMPNDEAGAYDLMRGMLEAGSFMNWFTGQHGLEAAQQLARGENIEALTGKSLAQNEAEWLQALAQNEAEPEDCAVVIPEDSVFRILCKNLDEVSD